MYFNREPVLCTWIQLERTYRDEGGEGDQRDSKVEKLSEVEWIDGGGGGDDKRRVQEQSYEDKEKILDLIQLGVLGL